MLLRDGTGGGDAAVSPEWTAERRFCLGSGMASFWGEAGQNLEPE